jgi:hypothetical protein
LRPARHLPCLLAERRLALEERGLALSTTALRFAYSYGGDGETNIKVRGTFCRAAGPSTLPGLQEIYSR